MPELYLTRPEAKKQSVTMSGGLNEEPFSEGPPGQSGSMAIYMR